MIYRVNEIMESPLTRSSTFTKKEKENLNAKAKQVNVLKNICGHH